MLRSERTGIGLDGQTASHERSTPHQLLLAVAPPLHPPAYALSGWPTWLIPAYRAGGHRPEIRLLEEER